MARWSWKPGSPTTVELLGKVFLFLYSFASNQNAYSFISLQRCMSQDCQQSLAGNSQSYTNYCRFLDRNGLCYSYKEAQVPSSICVFQDIHTKLFGFVQIWCSQNPTNGFCNSGGLDWAVMPVGNASSIDNTKWVPKPQCSCLKNCACSASTCWCARDQDTIPVGQVPAGQDYKILQSSKFGSNQGSKRGMCACSCGGVMGI